MAIDRTRDRDRLPLRHVGDAESAQRLKVSLLGLIEAELVATIPDPLERAAAARADYRRRFPEVEEAVVQGLITYGRWMA